jgi:hypothetical protein
VCSQIYNKLQYGERGEAIELERGRKELTKRESEKACTKYTVAEVFKEGDVVDVQGEAWDQVAMLEEVANHSES